MKPTRITTLAAALLWTALCAVTFAFLSSPAFAQGPPLVPGDKLQQSGLRLSPAQRQSVDHLQRESRAEADRLKKQILVLRKQLSALYRDYALPPLQVRVVHNQINEAQARLLEVHYETQRRLRQILSREQWTALRAAMGEDDEEEDEGKGPPWTRPGYSGRGHPGAKPGRPGAAKP